MNPDSNIRAEILAQHTFVCSVCGSSAGRVQIRLGEVLVWGFCGAGRKLAASEQEMVRAAVNGGDARALYACDPELAFFFCPSCKLCYCDQHWRHWDVIEEGGWFDCVRGICPQGHERILVD